jgi:hypothetical protein
MIQKMVVEDVSRFLGVAGILLAAFAHAFFILGRFTSDEFGTVLFRSLLALVGEGEVQVDSAEGPRTGNTAFQVAYLVGGSLVLLNVLIAMMGKTYEDVSSVAKVLATIERARIIREVEEGMTPAERLEPHLLCAGRCASAQYHKFSVSHNEVFSFSLVNRRLPRPPTCPHRRRLRPRCCCCCAARPRWQCRAQWRHAPQPPPSTPALACTPAPRTWQRSAPQ